MATQVIYGQVGGVTDTAVSTIDGLLKEHYVIDKITDTVNMKTYLLSRLGSEKTTMGRRFVFPLRFGVGEGQGNAAENADLPATGFGEYDQAFGNVVFRYGSLYITGPAIEATQGNQGAFASAMKQALKDCRDGFTLEEYRQSWGDGTGVMALVDGVVGTSATTVPVKNPYNLTYDEDMLEPRQKTRMFRKGMTVWFGTAAVARTITAVNGDGSIEISSAVAVTGLVDNELIYRGAARGLTGVNREYLGINGGVQATGTYLGVPRAGEPNWQAQIIDADGAELDEDLLQHAFDTAETEGDGVSPPDLLISEHRVRRFYIALLNSQKRFMNTMDLKGGFKGLEFNGTPWVTDKLCPAQRVYYLTLPNWVWMTMKPIGWLDKDGRILKWVSGKDAWQAYLAAYRQLVCKQPANQLVLKNIVN